MSKRGAWSRIIPMAALVLVSGGVAAAPLVKAPPSGGTRATTAKTSAAGTASLSASPRSASAPAKPLPLGARMAQLGTGKLGPGTMPSSPLLGVGLKLRGAISTQLGAWPNGVWQGRGSGLLNRAVPGAAGSPKGAERPGLPGLPNAPGRGATGGGPAQRSPFQADPHLSTTFTIVSTDYDYENSSGVRVLESRIKVTSADDGSVFEHVVRQTTDRSGRTTTQQSVVVKDKDGKVTDQEHSCTGSGCNDAPPAQPTATATATSTSTTPPADTSEAPSKPAPSGTSSASTPNPESTSCRSDGCANVDAITSSIVAGTIRVTTMQHTPSAITIPPSPDGAGGTSGRDVDLDQARKGQLGQRIMPKEDSATPSTRASGAPAPKSTAPIVIPPQPDGARPGAPKPARPPR